MLPALVFVACSMLAVGCAGQPGFGVDLTLRFDDSVSDQALAQVNSLAIAASGDDSGTFNIDLGRAAQRVERVVYRPKPDDHTIGLDVSAFAAAPAGSTTPVEIAAGSQPSITLPATELASVTITLSAPMLDASVGPADAAVDLLPENDDGGDDVDAATTPSLCATAGVRLCESFESTLGSAWSLLQMNGTATIDTSRAYRGTHALHMQGSAVNAGATIVTGIAETMTLETVPPDIYVRAFYYIPAAPVNDEALFSMVETAAPNDGVGLFDRAGGAFATDDSVSPGEYTSATHVPLNSWFCVEWHVHVATDDTGYVHIFVDDSEVADLEQSQATSPANGFGLLSVGAVFDSPTFPNPLSESWVDEVAVDNARIGCTK
jgi:hypothetical protein